MHGNVWEWVEDAWHDGYVGAPTDGTPWIKDADPGKRVLRGGGWGDGEASLRSYSRNAAAADARHAVNGFRVVRTLGP